LEPLGFSGLPRRGFSWASTATSFVGKQSRGWEGKGGRKKAKDKKGVEQITVGQ